MLDLDLGVAYALLAALFGGAYIYSIKRFLHPYPPATIAAVSSLVACGVYAPVLLRATANTDSTVRPSVGIEGWAFMTGAIALSGLGFLLFLRALEAGDVSYVAPLGKVVPAFVLPIELLVLQVFLTPAQALGVIVVTAGLYASNYQRGSVLDPLRRLFGYRPAQLALASAATYGVYDVAQRVILQEMGVFPQLWVVLSRGGIVLVFVPLVLYSIPETPIRNRWYGFVLVGSLNAGLAHFAILAFSLLPASLASPIVNAQSVVAVVLGGVLLGELRVRYRFLGALLVVAGIALIVVG